MQLQGHGTYMFRTLLMRGYGLLPISGAGVGMMGKTADGCKSVCSGFGAECSQIMIWCYGRWLKCQETDEVKLVA